MSSDTLHAILFTGISGCLKGIESQVNDIQEQNKQYGDTDDAKLKPGYITILTSFGLVTEITLLSVDRARESHVKSMTFFANSDNSYSIEALLMNRVTLKSTKPTLRDAFVDITGQFSGGAYMRYIQIHRCPGDH